MKKFLLLSAIAVIAVFAFAACNSEGRGSGEYIEAGVADLTLLPDDARLAEHGAQLVTIDGEEVIRFNETRNISVLAWNRSHDRLPHVSEGYWAEWIRAEALRLHNINVTFVEVDRWNDRDILGGMLTARSAPDVSMTFYLDMVEEIAGMGGMIDLAPLVNQYAAFFPNLYEMHGEEIIWWNRDIQTGNLWAFTGRRFAASLRLATYVREDWLNVLNIAPPTNHAEFEAMLIAFRDNAELLLGQDAEHMIPFRPTSDVGWTTEHIVTSFRPHDMTDREWYVYGFDDRRFMYHFMRDGEMREGMRLLNRWYNEGLIWRDFSLYTANDPIGDDNLMLGFVGAFMGNWDYPFRQSPGIITNMRENVGPHVNFIPVAPFENSVGEVTMEVGQGQERHIFFPHTNTDPIASLVYLDFISSPRVREQVMFGYYGVHFETGPDGALVPIPNDYHPDHQFIPSTRNFDLLPTFSELPPLANPALAALMFSYPGIEQDNVNRAMELTQAHAWTPPNVNSHVRQIASEAMGGGLDGMNGMGNVVLNQAINASIADFDRVFNDGLERYLNAGGRAIIEERRQAWIEAFGDVDWIADAE